jgi:diaminopropionate ammonia-lyase
VSAVVADGPAVALLQPRPVDSLDIATAADPRAFHASMPGYAPTALRPAPAVAAALGVAEVLVKDESARLTLPSFKVLGASWAVYRALLARLGASRTEVPTFDALREAVAPLRPLSLAAATDGNHGRAVAHMAALLGLDAAIYVPDNMVSARIDAIAGEGATVTVVDGGYDDAIRRSAQDASDRCLVISDTSWEGYEEVPAWVIEGYGTVFGEIEEQLQGREPPDVVAVPIGVGALAAAVVRHYWSGPADARPRLVGVEPTSAACVLESVAAG